MSEPSAAAPSQSFPLAHFITSFLATGSEFRRSIALQAWRVMGDPEVGGNNRGVEQYSDTTVYKGQPRDWCALSTAWMQEQVTNFAGTPKLLDFDTRYYLNSKDLREQVELLTKNAPTGSAVFRYENPDMVQLPQLGDVLSVNYPVKREPSMLETTEHLVEDLGLKPRKEWRWEKDPHGNLNEPSRWGHTCTIMSAEMLPDGKMKLLTIDGNSDSTSHGKAFVRMNEWHLKPDGTADHIGSGTMLDKGCYAYLIDISKLPGFAAAEEALKRKKAQGQGFVPTAPKDGQEYVFHQDAFQMLLGKPMQRSVKPPLVNIPEKVAALTRQPVLKESAVLAIASHLLQSGVKVTEDALDGEDREVAVSPISAHSLPVSHSSVRAANPAKTGNLR